MSNQSDKGTLSATPVDREERRGTGFASSEEGKSGRPRGHIAGSGFAFVTNIGHLPHECHYFEAADGVYLRKATLAEVVLIKQALQDFAQPLVATGQPWETTRQLSETEPVRDQPDDWRYHVLSFFSKPELIDEIQAACEVAPLELEIGMMFILGPKGFERRLTSPLRLYHALAGMRISANVTADFGNVTDLDLGAGLRG